MNPLSGWFEWQVVGRLGWTLLHSFWQGLLVAGLLVVILGLLRHSTPENAKSRYINHAGHGQGSARLGFAFSRMRPIVTPKIGKPCSVPLDFRIVLKGQAS